MITPCLFKLIKSDWVVKRQAAKAACHMYNFYIILHIFLSKYMLNFPFPSIAQSFFGYNPETAKPFRSREGVCTNWLPDAVGTGSFPIATISLSSS